ncbi:MAG: MMPL family transporter [Candidatus Methanoperedens sp.]|nr:MMPL family transporter [Candidatus Methanoperedens sp.]CAG0983731.1 putative transport protein MmpL9 [Methanosarcinales archaeon]
MADFLQTNLTRLAQIQKKHTRVLAIAVILITIFLGIGLKDLSINSDFREEMPKELPIFKINDRITDKFGGQDSVVIAVELDNTVDSKNAVRDIRDPRVIQAMILLDEDLRGETSVTSVSSPASFFRGQKEVTPENITKTLRSNPVADGLFSKNYNMALMFVGADIGTGEEQIQDFDNLIQEHIKNTPKPTGVKFGITGAPIIRMTIFDLLKRDAVLTLMVSATIILLLLFIMQRSFTHGLLVFAPLSLGLIWTMGTLGWLGIPLSIATVGLSSMILGLGVEYGVFVLSRYKEERAKNINQLDSMKTTVYAIGTAVIGSGLTTIVGFGVLSFASVPMIQHLGQTLALGIAYCLLAALFVNPVFILLEEDYEYWNTHRKLEKLAIKKEVHAHRGR